MLTPICPHLNHPCLTMSFLLRKTSISRLSNLKSLQFKNFLNFSTSTKISTGLTGLEADPSARATLLNLYGTLKTKLTTNHDIPEDYAYKKTLLSLINHRTKLLENESLTDFDLENEIGEGQLEELVEQAQEELELANKIINEWKPWENK